MKIFYYSKTLSNVLESRAGSVGFVPTMGALHDGHLDLVRDSAQICDCTVVSIFVNPRQFNNAEDLLKYPKTRPDDLKKLFTAGADFVFLPDVNEVYGVTDPPETNISPLDTVFEGHFRPGHFRGVTDVLYRLFSIVKPTHIFMGLKDLQQCLVVQKLLKQHFPGIQQYNQPTRREPSGLAMSSRNTRLTGSGKAAAAEIYLNLKKLSLNSVEFSKAKEDAIGQLTQKGIETEYLELVKLPDMAIADKISQGEEQAIVFAGYLEGVRLIDNMLYS